MAYARASQPLRRPLANQRPPEIHPTKPLEDVNASKTVKGMYYNQLVYRWEGNEKDLLLFDVFESDDSFDSTMSLPPYAFKTERHAALHLGLVVPDPIARVFESAIAEFKKRISPEDVEAFQTATLKEVWKAAKEIEKSHHPSRAVQFRSFTHSALKSLENYSKAVEATCNGTSYMAWIWGPFKLALQLFDEDRFAFYQLTDAYTRIGRCMSQFEQLHDGSDNVTPGEMVYWPDIQVTAVIYKEIMAFQRHAYHFYRRIAQFDFFWMSFEEDQLEYILKRLSNHDPLYEPVSLSDGGGNLLGGDMKEAKSEFPNDVEYSSSQSLDPKSTSFPSVPMADSLPIQYKRTLPPLRPALAKRPLNTVRGTIEHPLKGLSSDSELGDVRRDPLKATNSLYGQLSFQKAEIRLLTFTSEQTDIALRCTLTTLPLPKSPPYVALSYMWGDPTNTVPILVNNLEVQVTVNLRNALLRLRKEGVTNIWADAVCINQGDNEERTAQVGRMSTIFRKASQVTVWLGREAEILEQALQIYNTRSLYDEVRLSLGPFVRELISKPYWKRVWIIQEIAVASHINVYCGDYKIGWDQFVDMCSLGAGDNAPATDNPPDDETGGGFTTLLELRKDTLARKPIKFLDALHRSRASLSTDPRDKLYALLGLSYDGRHFIPEPNYMNSVAESFTEFATALIESGESLDFIYLRSASRENDGKLPSWVPDWTDLDNCLARRQLDRIMDRLTLSLSNSESTHVHKRVEIDGSGNELTINGVFVDTIDSLGGLPASSHGNTATDTVTASEKSRSLDIVSDTSDFVCRLMEHHLVPVNSYGHLIKWSVMGDIPQALLPQFNIWLSENHSFMTSREPLEDGAFGGDYDQFVRTVGFPKFFASLLICMQSSMRLTWTQKGDLGWVHPMAQKGDKIVRIFGCRQYVVLRAFETGEDYHVIGDVHLFGMSVDDLGDFGDDQVQSLKIH